jgi:Putative prokaryotic signal transducing protein
MIELIKTSDAVRLSFLRAVLKDAGIETAVFDAGAGSLWGAAITSRLMVDEADLNQAKRVIADAERQLGD